MDCTSSVSGPSDPKMVDSCCSGFKPGICDSPPIQSLPPVDERECQRRCRADKDCLFYSFSPQSCLLQSSCPPQRSPCPGCRSGPKRPPLDKVPESCGEYATTTGGLLIHLVTIISRSKESSQETPVNRLSHPSFADASTTTTTSTISTTTPVAPTNGLLLYGEMIGIPNDDN